MTSFSNTEFIPGFSSFPFSNRTTTFTALRKEEHWKHVLHVRFTQIPRVAVEGAAYEAVPCWLHTRMAGCPGDSPCQAQQAPQAGIQGPVGSPILHQVLAGRAPVPLITQHCGPLSLLTHQGRFPPPSSGHRSSCAFIGSLSVFTEICIH